MADTLPPKEGTAPAQTDLAGISPAGPAATAPASPSARITAPLFGGLRGGRKRKDGLVPGSPEALEADREKDRLRKERQRANERAATEPAPLPSAMGGQAAPPPGAVVFDPGPDDHPPLPWDSKLLEPLFKQLLPTVEALTVNQVAGKAVKARLPGELVKEIETEAKWPETAKTALNVAGPQLAAKWLNKSGISAENQPEVICGTALASILAAHVMLLRRLDALIAAANVPIKPAPAAAKPA